MIKERKLKDRIVVELPLNSEVIKAKEGLYIILLPTPYEQTKEKRDVAEVKKEEKQKEEPRKLREDLLRKLYKIPFKERELRKLKGRIGKAEVDLLKELIKEGKVYIRNSRGNKYIAFREDVYRSLREKQGNGKGGNGDYAILTEEEARKFLEKNQHIYFAVKHFDGKVYVVKKSFMKRLGPKVKSCLKSEAKHIEEISREIDIPLEGVLAILRLLNEAAEVVEVRKDYFSLPD